MNTEPLTSAELAAIEALIGLFDEMDAARTEPENKALRAMKALLRDLKDAREQIVHLRERRAAWMEEHAAVKQLLAALTSHVASSQPRDGYVVLEVPREVYEKAVQAGGGA